MTVPLGALDAIGSLGAATGAAPLAGIGAGAGAGAAAGPSATAASGGAGSFTDVLGKGLDAVSSAQSTSDSLAVQAATGQLTDISQYTVAASKAQVMTEFAAALRTKAVDAFNTVMGMQA